MGYRGFSFYKFKSKCRPGGVPGPALGSTRQCALPEHEHEAPASRARLWDFYSLVFFFIDKWEWGGRVYCHVNQAGCNNYYVFMR